MVDHRSRRVLGLGHPAAGCAVFPAAGTSARPTGRARGPGAPALAAGRAVQHRRQLLPGGRRAAGADLGRSRCGRGLDQLRRAGGAGGPGGRGAARGGVRARRRAGHRHADDARVGDHLPGHRGRGHGGGLDRRRPGARRGGHPAAHRRARAGCSPWTRSCAPASGCRCTPRCWRPIRRAPSCCEGGRPAAPSHAGLRAQDLGWGQFLALAPAEAPLAPRPGRSPTPSPTSCSRRAPPASPRPSPGRS